MIQAVGLTSVPRHQQRPAVDDLTFEARPGRVTVLLGPEGAGKTTTLQMLLQLRPGRGVALFNGRPMYRIPHPAREVGVLLGDVPGHPARTARSHLRMLAAVAGVPADRAEDVLDVVGLTGLADQRLGTFSRGMDRRLGIAAALLGDPHTLVLDEPVLGLSPREAGWLLGLLRGYAAQGGAVLVTSRAPRETARLADRVVSIDGGRLVADQICADFARARLRPRVAVHTPHADRLALLLSQEARAADRTAAGGAAGMEVVREQGSRISVYGSSCAEVGDVAYRNGIVVHQLADETGDAGDRARPSLLLRADGRRPAPACTSASAPTVTPTETEAGPVHSAHAAVRPTRASVGTMRVQETPGADSRVGEHRSGPGQGRELIAHELALHEAALHAPAASERALPLSAAPASAFPSVSGARPEGCPSETTTALADPARSDRPTTPLDDSTTAPTEPAAPGPAGGPAPDDGPVLSDSLVTDTPASELPRPHTNSVPSPSPPPLPPRLHAVPRPGPVAPFVYELRRLAGVRTTWYTLAAALLASLVMSVVLARAGHDPDGIAGTTGAAGTGLSSVLRMLTGWPAVPFFVLPPAAVAAGLLGALSFGNEFRFPALAPAQAPVPRRLGMLVAKLVVSAAVGVGLCVLTVTVDAVALTVLFGADVLVPSPQELAVARVVTGIGLPLQALGFLLLTVGSSWAGLLAAGVFRSTAVGAAAVVTIPLLIAPGLRAVLSGPAGRSLDGLPDRLASAFFLPGQAGADHWMSVALRLAGQPVGRALALSLTVLVCVYVFTSLRSRARWRFFS